MDPQTGLAIAQLGPAVLSGCLQGYKLFTKAKNLGKDSQALLWKFRIQETRLRMWGKEWGFIEWVPTSTASLARAQSNHDQVIETLDHIWDLLQDYKALKRRYGLALVMDDHNYRPAAEYDTLEELISREFEKYNRYDTVEELMSREVEKHHRYDDEIIQQRSRATEFLKKFRWVVSDREKLSVVISDLKDLNDGLYNLLSYTERRGLQQGLGQELETSESSNELEDLENAAAECENVPQMVSLKKERIKTEISRPLSPMWNTTFVPMEELQIPTASITLHKTFTAGQRKQVTCMATYRVPQAMEKSEPVIVEWKYFNKNVSNKVQFTQLSRIDSLARLLHISSKPSGLRVPFCKGYIQDEEEARIGFVFWLPQQPLHPGSLSSTSLYQSLGSHDVPYLDDRFRLAFELSNSLSILHRGWWLHKGIRSHNILFFTGQRQSSSASRPDSIVQLNDPCIVGFDYARPDDLNSTSSDLADVDLNLYRHPKAQGPTQERFCRAYDVYALGIVLLEIGFWRRIAEFGRTSGTAESFRRTLCATYVPKLGGKVGRVYMNVVARCLEGDLVDDEADMENGGLEVEENPFYWNVVRELSRLVA